jgi:hypothetical protein
MMRNSIWLALPAAWCLMAALPSARADTCEANTVAAAVDAAGLSLRQYNSEAQPKLRERLQDLSKKKGWSGEAQEDKALDYLQDAKSADLDTQANDLLGKIDTLGRPDASGQFPCANVTEIKAASAELLAVMKTKSALLNTKIDQDLGIAPVAAALDAKSKPSDTKSLQPAVAEAAKPPHKTKEPPPLPAGTPAQPSGGKTSAWTTTTAVAPAPPSAPGPGEAALPPITFESTDEGYTIDEIREASRGFFGTVSASLASVIEKAFAGTGRPTAYILGKEGGGAFLAGLRYGDGQLYMRQGGTQKVYWHGPSIGSDFGAEGGRTLILVYKLKEPDQLYRSFTGVSGSAYLVGGVGMTLLKGGPVIMAPIRSGLGLRVGANIGYLRFTGRPTWNPF